MTTTKRWLDGKAPPALQGLLRAAQAQKPSGAQVARLLDRLERGRPVRAVDALAVDPEEHRANGFWSERGLLVALSAAALAVLGVGLSAHAWSHLPAPSLSQRAIADEGHNQVGISSASAPLAAPPTALRESVSTAPHSAMEGLPTPTAVRRRVRTLVPDGVTPPLRTGSTPATESPAPPPQSSQAPRPARPTGRAAGSEQTQAPLRSTCPAQEWTFIDQARAALGADNPRGALDILQQYGTLCKAPAFGPEALQLQMKAHQRLGDRNAARRIARSLKARHPRTASGKDAQYGGRE